MVAFATPDQMKDRTRGAITATSHPGLQAELEAASKLIRDVCGWHIYPEQEIIVRRSGGEIRPVWIPATKISAVAITRRGAVEAEVDEWDWDPETGWTALAAAQYRLRFTAGYKEVPADLAALCLQVAARALGSPLGAVSESTLSASVSWGQVAAGVAGGAVLMQHEMPGLSKYIVRPVP